VIRGFLRLQCQSRDIHQRQIQKQKMAGLGSNVHADSVERPGTSLCWITIPTIQVQSQVFAIGCIQRYSFSPRKVHMNAMIKWFTLVSESVAKIID